MPQSVIGNHRQFVGFVLVGVVVAQKILQGTVGRVVAHLLGEYPVAPLPISPDFLTVAGLLIFLHQQIRTSPQQSHGILLQYP